MACPNCGDISYQKGKPCESCHWQPVSAEQVAHEREAKAQHERGEYKENMIAAIGCAVFFILCFYIFPSGRRASDWFELTAWEVLWALVLATIGFSTLFKK